MKFKCGFILKKKGFFYFLLVVFTFLLSVQKLKQNSF